MLRWYIIPSERYNLTVYHPQPTLTYFGGLLGLVRLKWFRTSTLSWKLWIWFLYWCLFYPDINDVYIKNKTGHFVMICWSCGLYKYFVFPWSYWHDINILYNVFISPFWEMFLFSYRNQKEENGGKEYHGSADCATFWEWWQ